MPEQPVNHAEHEMEPHPHDEHIDNQGAHDCPEHYHRCHTRTVSYGYMDCPNCHDHAHKPVTTFLTVSCGADDPKPQILQYLAIAANQSDTISAIVDLGHKGWLITFNHYA